MKRLRGKKRPFKDFLRKTFEYSGYTFSRAHVVPLPQHVQQITPQHFFDLFFSMADTSSFFFVQIGANDGKHGDLLHDYIRKYQLKGILIEPQSDVFAKLKAEYADQPQLQFANVAISSHSGAQPFYKVKKSLLTEENFFEATAIASFDKETFKKTLRKRIPDLIAPISENLEDYIEEEQIRALSFPDFARAYDVKKIDFLQVDCEGYDYEILKMFDFKTFSPRIVHYESKFFNDVDRAACEAMLHTEGYQTFRHGNDTCAFI